MRKPDFDNLLMVLNKEKPTRRTLFEFALSGNVLEAVGGNSPDYGTVEYWKWHADCRAKLGYDFICLHASSFHFNRFEREKKETVSLNDGALITDWDSFEQYKWSEPEDYPTIINDIILPDGMKSIVYSSDGLLENTIALMGYDNLCYALYEEEELVKAVFDNVGERLYRYFASTVQSKNVGALFINDDLGFNTQPFLSPEHLRKYVFPWHKKYVELAHREGKPAILHACGNLIDVYDDIIDYEKFDGKHSYEDIIQPVEEAYKLLNPRIAVLGGIDVDFLCRSTPEQITKRCNEMFEIADEKGGYAMGSGNSVPYYMPVENYFAMIKTIEK